MQITLITACPQTRDACVSVPFTTMLMTIQTDSDCEKEGEKGRKLWVLVSPADDGSMREFLCLWMTCCLFSGIPLFCAKRSRHTEGRRVLSFLTQSGTDTSSTRRSQRPVFWDVRCFYDYFASFCFSSTNLQRKLRVRPHRESLVGTLGSQSLQS